VQAVLSSKTAGEHLSGLSEATRVRLEAILFDASFDGAIRSDVVEDVLRLENGAMALRQFMVAMLPVAGLYSAPATSDFRVGAVCSGENGSVYFGANLELPRAALGFTVHAEQSAIGNAFSHGEKAVGALAVTHAPCGHCRQFLNELEGGSTLPVILGDDLETELSSLLPLAFGPADLGVDGGMLAHGETRLTEVSGAGGPLVEAALQAAERSYAPYTSAYSGMALQLRDGSIVTGSYLENAAHNPSLIPVLAAIDRLRFRSESYSEISAAVLVGMEDAKIGHEEITRVILESVAPRAGLRVLVARPDEP